MPGGYHRVCCCVGGEEPPPPPECCQCTLTIETECDGTDCTMADPCTTACCGEVTVTIPNSLLCPGTFITPSGGLSRRHCDAVPVGWEGPDTCTYDTCDPPGIVPCFSHTPDTQGNRYIVTLEFPDKLTCEGQDAGFCKVVVTWGGCDTADEMGHGGVDDNPDEVTVYSTTVEIEIPYESDCGDNCAITAVGYYAVDLDCYPYVASAYGFVRQFIYGGTCTFVEEWP